MWWFYAYLLICWGRRGDIIHQHGHQLGYSIHARREGAVGGRAVDDLALLLGLLHPLARYRVYNIEHSQLVGAGRLLEVSVDLLNQDGFRLQTKSSVVPRQSGGGLGVSGHTWTLLRQRAVMAVMREPETPGGLRPSMPCSAVSSSDTGEDMATTPMITGKRDPEERRSCLDTENPDDGGQAL